MSDGNQPADLPLPENAIRAACQRWLDREWPDGALTGTEYDIDHLAGAFKAGWAQGAAAERAAIRNDGLELIRRAKAGAAQVVRTSIREHLLDVVTENASKGNDVLLGVLLDAIRELDGPMTDA